MLRRTEDDSFVALLVRVTADDSLAGFFNISEIVRRGFQSAFLAGAIIAALGVVATLVLIRTRDSNAHKEMARGEAPEAAPVGASA